MNILIITATKVIILVTILKSKYIISRPDFKDTTGKWTLVYINFIVVKMSQYKTS